MLQHPIRRRRQDQARRIRGFSPVTPDWLERRDVPAVALGGGFLNAGPVGQYFANTTLSGTPAFSRQDDRIAFNWGGTAAPGGSTDPNYASVGADNFSVRWTGQFIPRFSDTYSLSTVSDGGVRLFVRPTGTTTWTTVIDDWADHTSTTDVGSYALSAGTTYDIEVDYYETTGPAAVQLSWSSASFSPETIDPIAQVGTNNSDKTALYADIVKGARNTWSGISGAPAPATDALGWPTGDGVYIFQESINAGLDIDPLMLGTITFRFTGKADVALYGNVDTTSLTYAYDPASNTTSGTFNTMARGSNASIIFFRNTSRDGTVGGPGGITDLQMMRPIAPGSTSSYPFGTLFTTQALAEMSNFTVIRQQLIANQQVNWSDRTLPGYFNQAGGNVTAPSQGVGPASSDGPSWEYDVMLSNETGRDLMISIPTLASVGSPTDPTTYISNLANLIKYGSDGVNPYTSPQANPTYPPLNSNLRVYLELGNELWNFGNPYVTDYSNINQAIVADIAANNAEFQAIDYDNLSMATNANGSYYSMNTWHDRWIALRMAEVSDTFRAAFGDAAMMTTVRPLLEWQYNNLNSSAQIPLTFLDQYFNDGDGIQHVANPEPVSYRFWGGGGATYYGLANPDGLTSLIPASSTSFASPVVAGPYALRPSGSPWSFSGTAGIAHDVPGSDVPNGYYGSQMGYITDKGSISVKVTFPTNATSNVYALAFKAVDRLRVGASAVDRETLRIYLDGSTDITAETFSQRLGVMAPAYNASEPWMAQNVSWAWSNYYATNTFTVAPGSTHTITIMGIGDPTNPRATNQTAFLEAVQVTSEDAIFKSGPTGGSANGQTNTATYQALLNSEASWAAAYGLQLLTYEGGWSLGGDDGGSPLELAAKYSDPRAETTQATALQMFQAAGGAVEVLGTYSQFPTWSDATGQQGLINSSSWPLIKGVADTLDALPASPTDGIPVPATLTPFLATLSNRSNPAVGLIANAQDWIGWDAIVPSGGSRTLTVNTTGTGGAWELLVDGIDIASGPSGVPLTTTLSLDGGVHSIRVLSTSSVDFTLNSVVIQDAGALAASPTLLSAVSGNGTTSLSWTPVDGATSYRVRYGFTRWDYSSSTDVGDVTSFQIKGLTNGLKYYFVVGAVTAGAEGLPSLDLDVVPLSSGMVGDLASWDFDGASGNDPTASPTVASPNVIVGPLTRGPGLAASTAYSTLYYSANRFAAVSSLPYGAYGTSLGAAIQNGQYLQFSISAAPNQLLSLTSLVLRAYSGPKPGNLGVTYSNDGVHFHTITSVFGGVANPPTPTTVWLNTISALQKTTATITFRVFFFGIPNSQLVALGDLSGDGVYVQGGVAPA